MSSCQGLCAKKHIGVNSVIYEYNGHDSSLIIYKSYSSYTHSGSSLNLSRYSSIIIMGGRSISWIFFGLILYVPSLRCSMIRVLSLGFLTKINLPSALARLAKTCRIPNAMLLKEANVLFL